MDRNAVSGGDEVTVSWLTRESGRVRLALFNSAGEFVRLLYDDDVTAGVPYAAPWDLANFRGEPVASGVYVLRANVPGMNLRPYRVAVSH